MSKMLVTVTFEIDEEQFPEWASKNKINDKKEFDAKIVGLEIGPNIDDFEPYDDKDCE